MNDVIAKTGISLVARRAACDAAADANLAQMKAEYSATLSRAETTITGLQTENDLLKACRLFFMRQC
jgi:hypothetical protein